MTRYGLDASVVIAFVTREDLPLVDRFWDSLGGDDELVGPQLLLPECTSVLRRQAFRGRITNDDAVALASHLVRLPIRRCESQEQFTKSIELAGRLNHSRSCDMQYLAVAQIENAELVTIDSGLRQAAAELGYPVRLLG